MVNVASTNSLARFGQASLIAWPIIGKPLLIGQTLETLRRTGHIPLQLIVVAKNDRTVESIKYEFQDHLYLYPLLGIDPTTHRGIQGKQVPITLDTIKPFPAREIQDPSYFNEFSTLNANPSPFLTPAEPLSPDLFARDTFVGKHACFLITGHARVEEDVLQYLTNHTFVLFDLVQSFIEVPEEVRILEHSICLTRNTTWTDFTIMHLTDLHIAKRYDDLLGVINANLKSSWVRSAVKWYDETISQKSCRWSR